MLDGNASHVPTSDTYTGQCPGLYFAIISLTISLLQLWATSATAATR